MEDLNESLSTVESHHIQIRKKRLNRLREQNLFEQLILE